MLFIIIRKKEVTKMTKAIGYIRVSTQDQADSGLSLTHQQNKIRAYCEALDLELVDVAVDAGYTARNTNRPALQNIMQLMKSKQIGAVVIFKLDRLTRNVKDLGMLTELFEKTGVSLISVSDSINTGTAAGRLVLNVLGSVAAWESESNGERVKAAMGIKKASGQLVGAVPFGYDLDSNGVDLIANESELEAILLMKELRANGASFAKIAAELEARGINTKKGKAKWQPMTISNILAA
jgi:site-specific DNA recombinase